MSLRDSINSILAIQPSTLHETADLLVQLTALYGNVSELVTETTLTYKPVLASHMLAEQAASKAKIKAECTPEYRAMVEAKQLEAVLLEHIRTLKISLRVRESDRRNY